MLPVYKDEDLLGRRGANIGSGINSSRGRFSAGYRDSMFAVFLRSFISDFSHGLANVSFSMPPIDRLCCTR
jgi:hypothetical protein